MYPNSEACVSLLALRPRFLLEIRVQWSVVGLVCLCPSRDTCTTVPIIRLFQDPLTLGIPSLPAKAPGPVQHCRLETETKASPLIFLVRGTGQHVKVSALLCLLTLSGETSVKFFCSNFLTFLDSCDNPPVTQLISQRRQTFVFQKLQKPCFKSALHKKHLKAPPPHGRKCTKKLLL